MVWWGSLLFGEWPDLTTWIGAVLIIGATFFITVRESQIKQKQPASNIGRGG
jgi:drug/metabolite transporter (DMT)-like permease